MIDNLKPGARADIIESNRSVREVTIKRISGNLCLVTYESGGGIQIGKHRLFPDRDAAEGYMEDLKAKGRNIDDLVQSIRMYEHVSDVRKGEYTLLDLLKK